MTSATRRRFVRECIIAAPVERVFAFHESPGALARLTPPWERVEILEPPTSLRVGTRVRMRTRLLPLVWITWEAEHVAYERNALFVDRQVRGPFAYWEHRHRFEPLTATATRLVDDVAYELPVGAIGDWLGAEAVHRRLVRLFEHRHTVTREVVERAG